MGTLCEFEQFLCVWRATGSQEISMNPKISRKCFLDRRFWREFVDQNVGNRPHGDSNCRGQLIFSQPLTEFSMNESFQIHSGTPLTHGASRFFTLPSRAREAPPVPKPQPFR